MALRGLLLLAAAICLLPSPADAASRRAAAKVTATAKGAACKLTLLAREQKTGEATTQEQLLRCNAKLDAGFAKAERRTDCLTTGDGGVLARIDGFHFDVGEALGTAGTNACPPRKMSAASAGARCLLARKAKEVRKEAAPDAAKEARAATSSPPRSRARSGSRAPRPATRPRSRRSSMRSSPRWTALSRRRPGLAFPDGPTTR